MDALDLLVATVSSMREEQRSDHQTLVVKVDGIAASISAHTADDTQRFAELDARLAPFESMRKTLRWAIGTMFVGFTYGIIDLFLNHLHK